VQACHSHAGYVLDQEGDSWCIAFHDALDAVAFSLQVRGAMALAAVVLVLLSPATLCMQQHWVCRVLQGESGCCSGYDVSRLHVPHMSAVLCS
jgi:hypothetical protein